MPRTEQALTSWTRCGQEGCVVGHAVVSLWTGRTHSLSRLVIVGPWQTAHRLCRTNWTVVTFRTWTCCREQNESLKRLSKATSELYANMILLGLCLFYKVLSNETSLPLRVQRLKCLVFKNRLSSFGISTGFKMNSCLSTGSPQQGVFK